MRRAAARASREPSWFVPFDRMRIALCVCRYTQALALPHTRTHTHACSHTIAVLTHKHTLRHTHARADRRRRAYIESGCPPISVQPGRNVAHRLHTLRALRVQSFRDVQHRWNDPGKALGTTLEGRSVASFSVHVVSACQETGNVCELLPAPCIGQKARHVYDQDEENGTHRLFNS